MAERRRLDHAEVEFYAQTETDAFWDSTEALSQRLGPGASAHDAIETCVAERGLSPTVARRLRQELRAELEANAADSAENQSLRRRAIRAGPVAHDPAGRRHRSRSGCSGQCQCLGMVLRAEPEPEPAAVRVETTHPTD